MANDSKTIKVKVVEQTAGPTGWILFVAWVGALVYFVQQSQGFWGFITAVLKSTVWPAYVLWYVLTLLKV